MLTYCVLRVASLAILTDNKASWRTWHKYLKANMLFERLHLNRLKLWWPGDALWAVLKESSMSILMYSCICLPLKYEQFGPYIKEFMLFHRTNFPAATVIPKMHMLEDKHFDCLRGSKTSNTSYCTSVFRSLYSYFPSAQVRTYWSCGHHHWGPFVKGLDKALDSFNVHWHAYYSGTYVGNHIHAGQQQPCSYLSIGVQYWLTPYKVLLHILVNFFQCLDLEVAKRNIVQPDGRTTFATYASRAYWKWKFNLHRRTSLQEKWQCIYKLCTRRRRSSDTHLQGVSFEVNGEFYFTSLLLGFPRRLEGVLKNGCTVTVVMLLFIVCKFIFQFNQQAKVL